MLKLIVAVIGILLALALVLKIANPLPDRSRLPADPAVPDRSSAFATQVETIMAPHQGETGIHALDRGIDAFAMRMALARAAQRTIDARYYIWEGDLSGHMLLAELIRAADRGVRVRILIDDNPTAGLDPMWAAANSHPNVTVRIFNPMVIRKVRALNYLFDFPRLNRRMHNKSMTVDGVASVVGGRNVGDEYFGAKAEGLFLDLDVLAIGDVVGDVDSDFDRYWSSEPSYPAQSLLGDPQAGLLDTLRHPRFDDMERSEAYAEAADTIIHDTIAARPGELFRWTTARLLSDNPDKALRKVERSDLLAFQIAPLIASAKSRFDLVSGYFVPGKMGSDLIEGLAKRGVAVRVVTNSIQVTDVPVVHAGYAPYREPLIDAGVKLYEAHPIDGTAGERTDLRHTKFSGGGESVHAKTFAIDDRTLFVGSFNFDPRSAMLNCEMGLVIDSPEMVKGFRAVLDDRVPASAYAVSKDADGSLEWTQKQPQGEKIFHTEPGTGPIQRAAIWLLGFLPIKWLL